MQSAVLLDAFNGCDRLIAHGPHAGGARACGVAVNQNGARATAALTAAVLAASQAKVLTEDTQQVSLGVGFEPMPRPVHVELGDLGHGDDLMRWWNSISA